MPVPVKVLFADDADLLMNKGKVDAAKAVAFQLDHTKPISDVLESLAELLQLPAAADHFALVLQENGQYVEEAADLEAVKADSVVLVKVQPRERVQQVLDQLALGPDASGLKNVIFRMRYQVVDPGFAEEFISRGGMEQLLSIVLDTTGNIQAYALTAVRCFMGYHNGLQEFLESPELIDKLFYLVDSKVVATVTRQAVELLFVLCNFDGWGLVHKAAKFTARIRGEQPYANVLKLLDSGDLDTKLNALTLLNSLLDNAPDKTKVQKMVLDWRNMDLSNVIYRLRKVEDPQLKTQLEIFESVAGEFLDVPSLSQADQLAQYEAQQPLLQLLVSELQHCYKLIQVAQESGALLSARAPSKRFEPSKGWARADRPVDLSFMQRGAATSNPDAINQKLTRLSEYFTQRQAGGGATRQGGGFGTRAMVKKPEQPAAPPASVEEATHAVNAPAETKSEVPDTPEVAAADSPDATLDSPDATLEASDAAPPPADDDTASSAPAAAVPATGEAAAPGMEGEVPAEGSGAPPAPPMPNGGGGAPPPPPMPGSGGAPPPPPMPGSGPPGPPPPPGSGPPPPPGMGGLGMGGVQPTKPVVKPTVKMKPLFWKRIILPASGEKKTSSIWSQVDELDINIREFEDAFRAKPTKKPKAKAEGESNEKFKRILDPKRSNAVAILCSGLPDPSRLVKAIEDLDSRVLKRDMIVQLINNAPTAEEIAAIKEAKAAGGAGLDMPEQFCLELSSVSKLKERLECWEFRMGFKEKYNDIEPPLFLAKTACKELKSSGKLRQTFGIILAVGNYMNGGSKRGQADGFQVDVLPKLMDTKDAEGNSLMEFVVQHMRKKHEALLKLPGELAHVPECRGLSLKQLQGDLRQLQGKVNLFKTKSKACLDAGVGGAFARVVNEFEKELEEKMTKVEKEYAEAEQKYNDILKFFSITTSMESDEFFGIFGSFVANFKFVIKKIEQDEAAKKKGSERKKVNAGKKIAGAAAGEADPMANIIAAIRAGKSSSLKDANKAASEEGEGEAPAPANPMSFGLRKVQRPEKPKEEPKKEEGFSFQLRKVQRDEKPAAKQEEAPAFTAPALRKVVREDKPKEPEKSGSLGFEVKLKPASERVIDAADDE